MLAKIRFMHSILASPVLVFLSLAFLESPPRCPGTCKLASKDTVTIISFIPCYYCFSPRSCFQMEDHPIKKHRKTYGACWVTVFQLKGLNFMTGDSIFQEVVLWLLIDCSCAKYCFPPTPPKLYLTSS